MIRNRRIQILQTAFLILFNCSKWFLNPIIVSLFLQINLKFGLKFYRYLWKCSQRGNFILYWTHQRIVWRRVVTVQIILYFPLLLQVFGYLLFMVLILPSIGLTTMRAFVEDVIKVTTLSEIETQFLFNSFAP